MDPCIDSYQHTEGPDDALVRSLVFDYLIHNCYGETAKAFFKDRQEIEGDGYGERLFWENDGEWTGVGTETGNGTVWVDGGEEWTRVDAEGDEEMTEVERVGREKQKDKEKKGLGTNGCREGRLGEVEVALRSLEARKQIRELIISGDIPSALSLCQKKFPRVVSSAAGHEWTTPQSIEMCFKLHCQQFVEIVRAGETTEALSFAQEVLRPYTEIDVANEDKYASALRGVIPLIAYREPETSPVGSHLSQTCRDKLADDVNSAILSFYNLPSQSAIERIVRQSTVVRDNLHSESSTKDKRLSKIYQKWQFSSFIQEG